MKKLVVLLFALALLALPSQALAWGHGYGRSYGHSHFRSNFRFNSSANFFTSPAVFSGTTFATAILPVVSIQQQAFSAPRLQSSFSSDVGSMFMASEPSFEDYSYGGGSGGGYSFGGGNFRSNFNQQLRFRQRSQFSNDSFAPQVFSVPARLDFSFQDRLRFQQQFNVSQRFNTQSRFDFRQRTRFRSRGYAAGFCP